jgi:hypothetical protein
MKTDESKDEWVTLGENDPPPDIGREKAAFERERPRLVRDHLGKVAVVHGDDLIGVYETFNEAVVESRTRLGGVRLIFFEITASDEPCYNPNVDIHHPSFRRID